MKTIVVMGAGRIGRMVAHFLGHWGDYELRVADMVLSAAEAIATQRRGCDPYEVDFGDAEAIDRVMRGADAVVSCAPFHRNPLIAERARENGLHYFDHTEDVAVTDRVEELAKGSKTAFVPQCGLAPGFITIIANHLISPMSEVTDLRMRVGALPRFPSNRLKYNLTWSTEGLINEYGNLCHSVVNGELQQVLPLEGLEVDLAVLKRRHRGHVQAGEIFGSGRHGGKA